MRRLFFSKFLIIQLVLFSGHLFGATAIMKASLLADSLQSSETPAKTLKRGTLITLSTISDINSREVDEGDIIEMAVHLDIKVENNVVLATQQFASARVKKVKKARKFGRGAIIELEALNVRTVDGQLIRLEGGKIIKKGNERRTLAWAVSIIPTVVCIAVSPTFAPLFIGFGLFTKGRMAKIEEGTLMTARVMKDTKVRS